MGDVLQLKCDECDLDKRAYANQVGKPEPFRSDTV